MQDDKDISSDLPWWARFMAALVPSHSTSEKVQYQWRVRMVLVSCFAFFASGYLLAAYNRMPYINDIVTDSQFKEHVVTETAKDNQQDALQFQIMQESKEQWASQLDAQILQLRKDQCRLVASKNPEAASLLFERIRDRMLQYFKLTGQQYMLPSCSDI